MTEPTSPTPAEWLLSEVERIDGCQRTKQRIRELLFRMAGQQIYLPKALLCIPDRVLDAIAFLDSGVPSSEVSARITRRYGVSVRTARRIVSVAINERTRVAVAPGEIQARGRPHGK